MNNILIVKVRTQQLSHSDDKHNNPVWHERQLRGMLYFCVLAWHQLYPNRQMYDTDRTNCLTFPDGHPDDTAGIHFLFPKSFLAYDN